MEHVDVLVIGAGVTGLAAARAISALGPSTCVLERHPRAGLDTSTHNSGVIHAGLYYPSGSLKAELCVTGRRQMYKFCREQRIPHANCGKLVVADSPTDVAELERLKACGEANLVKGLQLVGPAFIRAHEPAVKSVAALWSPESGIVNAEELVKALLRTSVDNGVAFLPATRPVGADPAADGLIIRTERETIHARAVVNAAGLYADEISTLLGGERFTIYPCRGEYTELVPAKRSLVNGLVYPLPDPSGHGLGVHLVRTTGGQVWLGPTIAYQERKDDYESGRLPLEYFAAAASRLLDGVRIEDLRLSGSGIRAKLHPPSERFADFLIRRDRNNPRIVQAAGIDSPGLTSCLAVGDLVSRLTLEIL